MTSHMIYSASMIPLFKLSILTPPPPAFHFNPVQQLLAVGTEQLAVLKLDTPPGIKSNIVQSHRHPVVAVRYSRCFNQLVTACEGAVSTEALPLWKTLTVECSSSWSVIVKYSCCSWQFSKLQCSIPVSAGCEGMGALFWQVCV